MTRAEVESSLLPALQVRGRPRETHHLVDRMRRYAVPGVAVAVIVDRAIAWSGEYGSAGDGRGPVRSSTLFQAASISKAVAALGVMVLVEHGDLDLDDDVNRSLRSWRVPASAHTADAPVTLRHLLSHTAGTTVPGFPGYARGEVVPSPVQVLAGAAPANTPAVESFAAPGTVAQYSGGGSTIVQQLVSDVTGRDFAELMRDLVLGPLAMVDSGFDQPIAPSRARHAAAGHRADGTPLPGGHHVYPELQAAGLWTTATDLARWVIAVQAALAGEVGSIVGVETARSMVEVVPPGVFGLGPEIAGGGRARRFGHGGSNAGFRGQVDGLLDGRSGMVILTNGDGGTTLSGEFRRAVASVHDWGEVDVVEIDVVDVDPGLLQRYTGRYRGPFGLPMRLEHADGELYSPAPYGRRRMFAIGPSTFIDEESGATIEIETDGVAGGATVRRIAVLVGGAELMAFEPDTEE